MLESTLVNKELQRKIESAISTNRFPHAIFLKGAEGSGGLPLAFAIAKEILRQEKSSVLFDGADDTRALRIEHPDLHLVFPIQQLQSKKQVTCAPFINKFREYFRSHPFASFQNWLDHIGQEDKNPIISVYEAESMIKKLSLKSFEGGSQVLVIWKPELMNSECANKLLKLIEEPEPGNVIIMVGDNWQALLPTIRSRVQLLNQKPFSDARIQSWLMEHLELSEERAMMICEHANGNPGKAIELAYEDNEMSNIQKLAEDWWKGIKEYNRTTLINWVDEFNSLNKNEKQKLLRILIDNLTLENGQKELSEISFYQIEKLSSLLEESLYKLYRNAYAKTLFLDLSLKASKIMRTGIKQKGII